MHKVKRKYYINTRTNKYTKIILKMSTIKTKLEHNTKPKTSHITFQRKQGNTITKENKDNTTLPL